MQSQLCTGALAQLVEQRTENPCVPGSIPGGTTLLKSLKFSDFFYVLEPHPLIIFEKIPIKRFPQLKQPKQKQ